jgi:hypothetical protein
VNLIKNCPACGRKLRFPIDRGKIRVRCVCGESFIADPDDTALYKDASFDIARENRPKSGLAGELHKKVSIKGLLKIRDRLIERIYKTRYTLQNYPLLPANYQRRIMVLGIAAGIVVAALLYLAYVIYSRSIPPEGVII